jgi:hypothetical protein
VGYRFGRADLTESAIGLGDQGMARRPAAARSDCHGSSHEVALLLPREAVLSSRGYCFQSKESPAGSAAAVAYA